MTSSVCTICGNQTVAQQHWYLIAENPWEDRVKIVHWQSVLALSPGILAACGAAHVRDFLTQWLNSEILPASQKSLPPLSARRQRLFEAPAWELASHAQPVGELAIHRRTLQDDPAIQRTILNAVFQALEHESADFEVFEEHNVLSYSPLPQEIVALAHSASA